MATMVEKRTRLTAAERSQQVLDVAEELFMAQGFDGTSMEDIARAAGVSRPIVYTHHGSKEGVYIACLARARTRLLAEYEAALDGVTGALPTLRCTAEVWFSVVERDPERWALLFGTGVPLAGAMRDVMERTQARNTGYYVAAVRRWARDDVSDETVEVTAQMVAGVGSQLAHWWLAHRHVPRARVVDRYVAFCGNGLRPLIEEGAGHD